jgi:hypothetical protein
VRLFDRLYTATQKSKVPAAQGRILYEYESTSLWWRGLILAALLGLTFPPCMVAADEPTLTEEQIKQFLLTAKPAVQEGGYRHLAAYEFDGACSFWSRGLVFLPQHHVFPGIR